MKNSAPKIEKNMNLLTYKKKSWSYFIHWSKVYKSLIFQLSVQVLGNTKLWKYFPSHFSANLWLNFSRSHSGLQGYKFL
jgi:hypothetical protein